MSYLKIVACDRFKTDPAFPEITEKNFQGQGIIEGASILEAGMKSGKTSIGIVIKMQNGKYVMAEISKDMFEMLTAAVKGAEANWADRDRNAGGN